MGRVSHFFYLSMLNSTLWRIKFGLRFPRTDSYRHRGPGFKFGNAEGWKKSGFAAFLPSLCYTAKTR
jgi:hypothetical protein